ncbi:MAG: 2-nitropropane dioxygenase [marine bacterium B5-7]|nr:MAG: 2-nitropropane dioxygenase [marine bacterium B5-7]
MWPDRKFLDLAGVDLPVIQAPMAGANGSAMAIQVCKAGGLGSLPCAVLNAKEVRSEIQVIRQHVSGPLNVNFFCHADPESNPDQDAAWKQRLAIYYDEYGLDASVATPSVRRSPFNSEMCEIVEEYKPEVVSFHFGLPQSALVQRVKKAGCLILSSATTVDEAHWLEQHGCDAIIAQGYEAGGHRGMFITKDINAQPGTLALVPQVVDAVDVPVIAAGGIADGRGIAAAFALGASAVQVGTAYLFTPQSLISDLHRAALHSARDDQTMLTNVFSGKPARSIVNRVMREVGPLSDKAPAFPTAGSALAALKVQAEALSKADFSSLWSGQAASLCHETSAFDLTRKLADDTRRCLETLASNLQD